MADSKTLVRLIEILEPLTPEDRHRNINATLTYLGDPGLAPVSRTPLENPTGHSGDGQPPAPMIARMKQYGIAHEHLERVFSFHKDGTFAILDVPGKGMRDKTLNMYILTGLGTFLATGERFFTDALARGNCEAHSCLDSPNHAKTLGAKHPEFSGDKNNGWSIAIPGIRRGAELVKAAGAAGK